MSFLFEIILEGVAEFISWLFIEQMLYRLRRRRARRKGKRLKQGACVTMKVYVLGELFHDPQPLILHVSPEAMSITGHCSQCASQPQKQVGFSLSNQPASITKSFQSIQPGWIDTQYSKHHRRHLLEYTLRANLPTTKEATKPTADGTDALQILINITDVPLIDAWNAQRPET